MPSHRKLPYRPDLQALRALAILVVLLAHAGIPIFDGGFIGVDIFFVLSGFLITGILTREYEKTETLDFKNFIARRLKRLLPSLIVMLVGVMVVSSLLISRYEFAQQTSSAPFASTWTSNIYFAFSTKDYFSEAQTRDLFLHTWSLGVEEQFYIIWPALLLIILTIAGKDILLPSRRQKFYLALAAVSLGSFLLSQYWAMKQPLWSFYLMPTRIWQFALGAIVYIWAGDDFHHEKGSATSQSSRRIKNALGIAGLSAILFSTLFFHRNMTYPGYWALLPSLGAALFIASGSRGNDSEFYRVVSRPAMIWIGDRSYSLYLWHWPVFVLLFAAENLHPMIEAFFAIVLSFGLAMLSYRMVELPFWKGSLSRSSSVKTIAVGLMAMAVAITLMPKSNGINWFSGDEEKTRTASSPRDDVPGIYSDGCDSWIKSAELVPCTVGPADAGKTVVLLADSIGAQWVSLLTDIYKAPTWRVVVLTKSSCPIVDEEYFYSRIGRVFEICSIWREAALKHVSDLKPDLVFIGNDTSYEFTEKQWVEGSSRILRRLTNAAKNVVVLAPTPALGFDGPGCIDRNLNLRKLDLAETSLDCRSKPSGQIARYVGYIERSVKHYPNARLLNLNDLVCPDGVCSALTSAGLVVFRDEKHLTDKFVRAQVPEVLNIIKDTGLAP